MVVCFRTLLACTLALISLPAAHAQTRRSTGAWTVLCSGGPSGYCYASNRLKSAGSPYRFQLNVSRGTPGADFEIALLTGREQPGEGAVMLVKVDGAKPLSLTSGEGYRRAGRSHTYIVASAETANLLQQMRNGARARFSFQNAKGGTVDAAFSLRGLADAMRFMDKMQPSPRPPASRAASSQIEDAGSTLAQEAEPATAAPTPPTRAAAPQPAPGQTVEARSRPAPEPESKPAPPLPSAPVEATAPKPAHAQTAQPNARPMPEPESKPALPVPSAPVEATAPEPAHAQTIQPNAGPTTKPQSEPAATAQTAPIETKPEPKHKQTQALKQAAVNVAPTLSRKRGAKSIRQFSCRGNEPSWTFVVDKDSARYAALTDSGQNDEVQLNGKLKVTGDGPTPIIDWRGKSDWGGTFRAVISEEYCRDTMAGPDGQVQFDYRAELTLPGGKTVRGCCNAGLVPMQKAAAADNTQYPIADVRKRPETDWSRYLFDLLPAIQACIDKTPEPDPYATKAWPMDRGMVGVRTRNGRGGWFECVAEGSGKRIDRFVKLPPTAPPAPNEDRVVFSPPDQPPPKGNCFHHERVMDGMGDFMGWLSTNGCG